MYKHKYLKYKQKYLLLKELKGGEEHLNCNNPITDKDCSSCKKWSEYLECEKKLNKYNNLKFLEKIDIINGPHTLNYFNIPLDANINKKILIFGENHLEFKECNNTNNCIEIERLLDTIINFDNNICIDYFLEMTPKKNEGWNGGSNENYVMIKLRNHALKLQEKDNVRVQKWDLRSSVDKTGRINNKKFNNLLLLNEYEIEFLKNFNGTFRTNKLENYKNNIKQLLSYLLINNQPNINVKNIINILSMYKSFNSIGTNIFIEEDIPVYIIEINKKLKEIIKKQEYNDFLKLLFEYLPIIKQNNEIQEKLKFLNKLKQDIKKTEEENEGNQKLFYDPRIYKTMREINELLKSFFEEKINNKLLKMMTNENFIFVDILLHQDLILKSINFEINFYYEIEILKNKLNKTYNKFLKFCQTYPNVFGTGENIKEIIIDIMLSDNIFPVRFIYTSGLNGKIMGLQSTFTDVYTFLRMFIIFDDEKERKPIKCSNIKTPEKIIIYAGSAHIDLYNDILKHYSISITELININNTKNKISLEINDIKKQIMNIEKDYYVEDVKNRIKEIHNDILGKTSSLFLTEEEKQKLENNSEYKRLNNELKNYKIKIEPLNIILEELEEKIQKDTLSNNHINLNNALVNNVGNLYEIIINFLT
jgi:hypothetical protein